MTLTRHRMSVTKKEEKTGHVTKTLMKNTGNDEKEREREPKRGWNRQKNDECTKIVR